MEAKNTVIISGTEALARGEMVNLALSTGALVLDRTSGDYAAQGCYLTPQLAFPAFDRLMASWDADTPRGTAVEAQVRVQVEGRWSGWFSFGKWSPFLPRAGEAQPAAAPAYLDVDTLCMPQAPAEKAQLRVFLYTERADATPALRLLAASVRPKNWEQKQGEPFDRAVHLPAYSQMNRDPAFGPSACNPVTLAMLMNRYGEDLLPEELALAMYDEGCGCANRAYGAAAAGCYGYEAYLAYLDLAGLRAQIKQGYGVGVCVHYTNNDQLPEAQGLPLVEGAEGIAPWHVLAVRGFMTDGAAGEEYVLVNDPFCPNDSAAEKCYKLSQFLQSWDNVCYVGHRKRKGAGQGHPERFSGQLKPQGPVGAYQFEVYGQPHLLPAGFLGTPQRPGGTVAYTQQEEVAHATTAHKHFGYAAVNDQGGVQLPAPLLAEGKKVTVYVIDNTGSMLVAELKP